MKKPDPINKVQNNDEFSSGLMESYGKWMGGDCFQNTQMPDIHEAPFDGMDPQSNGAEIEQTSIKKKEVKKPSAKAQLATKEEYEVLEREEYEIDGETWVLEKRLYAVEGSMETARKNVGASTCWKGYKAAGTKKKNGKTVPNCVKAGDEITHEGEELEEQSVVSMPTSMQRESVVKHQQNQAAKTILLRMRLRKQQRLLRKKRLN